MNEHPDSNLLKELFAMPSLLEGQASRQEIAQMLVQVMGRLPGVGACQVCLAGGLAHSSGFPSTECSTCPQRGSFPLPLSVQCNLEGFDRMPLATAGAVHGFLVCSLADPEAFAAYRPFVENFCHFVALSLECRLRAEDLQAGGGAGQEHCLEHLRFLECLDRVNRAILATDDPEAVMSDVLDSVLSIFDCDRTFLLSPCDPEAPSWHVPVERTKPQFPGAFKAGAVVPMDDEFSQTLRIILSSGIPSQFGPHHHPLPEQVSQRFGYKSAITMALHPRLGKPWIFGMHQCSYARNWTPEEERLFQEIGRRISDALTGLLAHRASRESESRYRRITEALTDYQYSVRVENGRASERMTSSACVAVTGYTSEEYAADPRLWLDRVVSEDREMVQERFRQILAGKDVPPLTHRIVRKDGAECWVCETTILQRDASGQLLSFDGVLKDITSLKLAEERLRKLSRAVEQSPASIVITDLEARIEYVNPKFSELTGYTSAEVLGRNPSILQSGETPAETYEQMWRALCSGKEWQGEFSNRKKNGERYWELASISPIFNATGTVTHYLGIKEDITERKRREVEVRQTQKMEALGQLAGGVAHDFNNVLTVIQCNASLLDMGGLNEVERAGATQQISEATERASRLTRQLLMFSRRQPVQQKSLDLNEVVLNMTKMLRRLIGDHISLVAHCAEAAPVFADTGMLEQILLNLALNARDAMPHGGRLEVNTDIAETDGHTGKFVRLQMSDDGVGIAPDALPHIFEPFYTTKEVGQGTGLGLATVLGIVEQHQGWVEVESVLGSGTTFKIYFPCHEGAEFKNEGHKRALEGPRGFETILLVEDESSLRQMLREVLERHGYRVYIADSAQSALAVWSKQRDRIALVLTDMVMPGGTSGWELGQRLESEKPGLKVIYSTGYTDEMLGAASALRGTPIFLEKPYYPGELLRTLRACLDAAHSPVEKSAEPPCG